MRGLVHGVGAASLLAAGLAIVIPGGLPAQAAAACSPALRAISLSPASVPGGATSTVTVTVSCAPKESLPVSLKGFPGATVAPVIRVAAGKTTATSVVTTATRKTALHGTITAAAGKAREAARLTIEATPRTCRNPVLSAMSLPGLAYVGDRPDLAVKLSCVPATATRLTLKSTSASLPVPASVVIGAYYSSATIRLAPMARPAGKYAAGVSVRYGSRTLARAITVDPGLSKFVLEHDSSWPDAVLPDVSFTGGIPAGGLTIRVTSDNPAVTVPPTVDYAQRGATGGEFTVLKVAGVTVDTKVTLSVSLGSRTLTASITLLPPWKPGDGFRLTPDNWSGQVYGGSVDDEASLNLGAPLDPDGPEMVGNVSVTGAPYIIPDWYADITPGSASTVISFVARDVSIPVTAELTVIFDGVSESFPIKVEPGPWKFTVPATMVSGQTTQGTITLAGAPDVPTAVHLLSQSANFTISPASLTIPSGKTSATFTITARPVTADTQALLFATVGNVPFYSSLINITP